MFWALTEEVQQATRDILSSLERLVDARRDRSRADPFVVGLAKVCSAGVVTGEQRSRRPNRPKIPDACDVAGVKFLSLPELIEEQDWTFRRL